MAVVRRQVTWFDRVLRQGYLWAALSVALGLAVAGATAYLVFRPMRTSSGQHCGTWFEPGELVHGDGMDNACGTLQVETSIAVAALALLTVALLGLGVWLALRTRRARALRR